jgi:hypothetical protein
MLVIETPTGRHAMQTNVFNANGKKAVAIQSNDAEGSFSARLYLNCQNGQLGDATMIAKKFTTLGRAQTWAAVQVAK